MAATIVDCAYADKAAVNAISLVAGRTRTTRSRTLEEKQAVDEALIITGKLSNAYDSVGALNPWTDAATAIVGLALVDIGAIVSIASIAGRAGATSETAR